MSLARFGRLFGLLILGFASINHQARPVLAAAATEEDGSAGPTAQAMLRYWLPRTDEACCFLDPDDSVEPGLIPVSPDAAALAKLKARAKQKPALANALGVLTSQGRGVAADEAAALKLFLAAAKAGHAGAKRNAATRIAAGRGAPVDLAKAVELMRAAANAGLPAARNDLGVMTAKGIGLPPDPAAADKLWADAAAQGHPKARLNHALALLNGTGVERDEVGWAELLSLAEDGDQTAQFVTGRSLVTGGWKRRDAPKGVALLRRAANAGLADAQIALAGALSLGFGTPADRTEALVWARRAAEQHDMHGEAIYGWMLLIGHAGGAPDPSAARPWLTRASEKGDADADFWLGMMSMKGWGGLRAPPRR
jgi:TPR repeat protein